MEKQQSTLGRRLYVLRKYRALSLQELSNTTGISRSNLNRYERDESRPTSEFLKILCEYYHVSADWLLFGMQSKDLKQQGWDMSDPELREMIQKLSCYMSNENPHIRSWAIVQFANAFHIQKNIHMMIGQDKS